MTPRPPEAGLATAGPAYNCGHVAPETAVTFLRNECLPAHRRSEREVGFPILFFGKADAPERLAETREELTQRDRPE
jgi:hypothetical protein